jgi:hypothetical protein
MDAVAVMCSAENHWRGLYPTRPQLVNRESWNGSVLIGSFVTQAVSLRPR